MTMSHQEALEVLAGCRGRHIVITTHGSVDPWVALSDTPLDFSYVPAAMGQGPRSAWVWRWRNRNMASSWSAGMARCS